MTGGWLIWVIIGITVIQWIYGKAQEQAELNRAKRERERARDAALRTGRGADVSNSPKPGQMSESELQARRQAQLKVLRERQAQQQRQAPTRSVPPRSVPTPRPASPSPQPTRRIPPPQPAPTRTGPTPARPPQRPSAPARPSSAPLPGRAAPSPVARSQQQPSAAKPPAERVRAALQSQPTAARTSAPKASRPLGTLATIASERREQSLAAPASSDLVPRTNSDWRRAIVASEILAPPVSMREG